MLTKDMDKKIKQGDRVAKVIARAGFASRRAAEKIILDGRVAVNGKTILSAALNVKPTDKITIDEIILPTAPATRLWKYNKPVGLVTSEKDEKGRKVVFDNLPASLPRVLSVGRLDLNSEGLLLLTNDGVLKRQLELPSTGWTRKYRVRVNGEPSIKLLQPLMNGIIIDGEKFKPMTISIDRQQGANAWLTISIKEGKNREIRRALDHLGFKVNRLIRISYGPFRLEELKSGAVEEIRTGILKAQLGNLIELKEEEVNKTGSGFKKPLRRKKKMSEHLANPSKKITQFKVRKN